MGPRAIAWYASRDLRLDVEGLENVPERGPALIAARHYHHLYDGAAFILSVPRMVHIFVALDWVSNERERAVMEWACKAARWPVALRPERFSQNGATPEGYRPEEISRYVRRSIVDAAALLAQGRVLVMFPEGFPTIEAHGRRTRGDADILPFAPGFVTVAARAQRIAGCTVPIVPAGLRYRSDGRRQHVSLRFGAPVLLDETSRAEIAARVQRSVRGLSDVA